MSNVEQGPGEAPAARQGGKGLIAGMAIVLAAATGVGAYALAIARHASGAAAAHAAAAPEANRPALYLPLDPPFVVNFRGQQAVSYLQVGVTLMAHDPAAIKAAKDAEPVIRNALVMLFSSQGYDGLSTTAGKQKLRGEALQAVQKAMRDGPDGHGIDALYFTSFVMQ